MIADETRATITVKAVTGTRVLKPCSVPTERQSGEDPALADTPAIGRRQVS